jgi:hypothetical protein
MRAWLYRAIGVSALEQPDSSFQSGGIELAIPSHEDEREKK